MPSVDTSMNYNNAIFADLDTGTLSVVVSLFSKFTEQISYQGRTPPLIKLAWEETDAIQKAVEIMRMANAVVIIGYSFPVFNRTIDARLFDVIKRANRPDIYLQLPQDSIDAVKERVEATIRVNHDQWAELQVKKIKTLTAKDEFYLPFNFSPE